MKVSARGDYACRALLELALEYDNSSPVQLDEIARKQLIPKEYLVQILLMLKSAGLVRSKRGAGGGYMLARPPADITLGEVVRLVDGPLLPTKCAGGNPSGACVLKPICAFHPIWEEIRGVIAEIVDGITYEDLCNRTNETSDMYYI
jgi:Rrf2 family protein